MLHITNETAVKTPPRDKTKTLKKHVYVLNTTSIKCHQEEQFSATLSTTFTFENQSQCVHHILRCESGQRSKHLRFWEAAVSSYTELHSIPVECNTKEKPH